MPYKIIQTIEKGRSVLTSIPDTWENGGILLWPRKQSDKLKRSEKNHPQDNWVKSSCIVKRRNLLSYEEAEKEIEDMCNYSDTEPFADTEHEEPSPPKQKKRKLQPTQYFHNEDFNSLAQVCLLDKGQTSRSPKASRKADVLQKVAPAAESMISTSEANFSTPETCTNLIAAMSTFLPIDSDNTLAVDFNKTAHQPANDGLYYTIEEENPSLTEKIDNIVTQIPLLLENQKLIINNQKLLSENQQIMIMKIAEISEFVKHCNSTAITKESSEHIQFKIINCPDDAEILESKLKDEEYKTKLKNKFSVVCGKGKGLNNAYVLIDLIFTRQFLNQCSWAGGSRKGESKICFRAYTRIFDFFFDLIRMTDNNFTKEDCKTFFKNILRNSMSRINCKQMRASSSRNRPKLIKVNKLETKVTSDEAPTASKPSMSEEARKSNSSNEESLC